MKVAIDISPLHSGHKVRGVGFYLKHLKDAFAHYEDQIDFQYFSSITEVNQADLVHYPFFDPFSQTVLPHQSIPTIVTVHDLTPIVFSKYFPVGIKGTISWQLNKIKSKKFAGIITDSESSKKDIVSYMKYPESKVSVAYLAAGEHFLPAKVGIERQQQLAVKYSVPEHFVLYVGDITWNKNVPRLIEACVDKNIQLVMIGKALAQKDFDLSHPWNKDLVTSQKLIERSKNVRVLGFVPDEDLVDLYRTATLLAMPSLYEGFGLPVVEAMQTGVPVVTSKEGSLTEVGGDAVYYVDPYDKKNIAEGIAKVFYSKDLQKELSEKGKVQSKKFSWRRTAEQTIAVYKNVLHQ